MILNTFGTTETASWFGWSGGSGVHGGSSSASDGSYRSRNTREPDSLEGSGRRRGGGCGSGNRWFRLLYILFKNNFDVNLVS